MKLAKDLADKDKLYRWDLTADAQDTIVRLAMLSCANVAFELRQAWLNESAMQADHDAPTREVPRTITREFEKL